MRWRGVVIFFSFKQKPAYEMRISDWSSDVCSSDLHDDGHHGLAPPGIGAPDHCNLAHRWVGREHPFHRRDRNSVVSGTRVSVRVDLGGGRRVIKTNQSWYTPAVFKHIAIPKCHQPLYAHMLHRHHRTIEHTV